jgi:hypothetical protein
MPRHPHAAPAIPQAQFQRSRPSSRAALSRAFRPIDVVPRLCPPNATPRRLESVWPQIFFRNEVTQLELGHGQRIPRFEGAPALRPPLSTVLHTPYSAISLLSLFAL